MKTCNKCNISKSFENFSRHSTISDGYYNQCKSCRLLDRNKREQAKFAPTYDGDKICLKCNLSLSKNQFLLNKSTQDGFNGWCKSCTKSSALYNKYSISLEQYNFLLKKQNNSCAICNTTSPKGPQNVFVVDHCHNTGKVRGLLCNHCNTGLGKLGDTKESLKKAIDYLDGFSGKILEGESFEK